MTINHAERTAYFCLVPIKNLLILWYDFLNSSNSMRQLKNLVPYNLVQKPGKETTFAINFIQYFN